MSSQKEAENTFERVIDAAPDTLYGDYSEASDLEDRYVVFEYEDIIREGVGVISSREVGRILEAGAANDREFPLFRGIEASEGYVRKALENNEGLMAARIRDGEISDTGYIMEEGELKGLMTFSSTH